MHTERYFALVEWHDDRVREKIRRPVTDAGWIVHDKRGTTFSAGRGVAVRMFPLRPGHGEADYLLFVDGAPLELLKPRKRATHLPVSSYRSPKTARPPQRQDMNDGFG